MDNFRPHLLQTHDDISQVDATLPSNSIELCQQVKEGQMGHSFHLNKVENLLDEFNNVILILM